MSETELTLEQVIAALSERGPADENGRWPCPICRQTGTLAVDANGGGPHYECATGCEADSVSFVMRDRVERAARTDEQQRKHERRQAHNNARLLTGLPICAATKHGRAGGTLDVHLEGGATVELGTTQQQMNMRYFKSQFIDQADLFPKTCTTGEHETLVFALSQMADRRDVGMTTAEETAGWLADYLSTTPHATNVDITDSDELYDALSPGVHAFRATNGRTYLRLRRFALWINRTGVARITVPELSVRLGRLNFTKVDTKSGQLSARRGDNTRKARFWQSAPGFEVDA